MFFLYHYEGEWLDSSPIEFNPKSYKRYIDDIVVMFRSRNHAKKFFDYMNTKHPIKLSESLRKKLFET